MLWFTLVPLEVFTDTVALESTQSEVSSSTGASICMVADMFCSQTIESSCEMIWYSFSRPGIETGGAHWSVTLLGAIWETERKRGAAGTVKGDQTNVSIHSYSAKMPHITWGLTTWFRESGSSAVYAVSGSCRVHCSHSECILLVWWEPRNYVLWRVSLMYVGLHVYLQENLIKKDLPIRVVWKFPRQLNWIPAHSWAIQVPHGIGHCRQRGETVMLLHKRWVWLVLFTVHCKRTRFNFSIHVGCYTHGLCNRGWITGNKCADCRH